MTCFKLHDLLKRGEAGACCARTANGGGARFGVVVCIEISGKPMLGRKGDILKICLQA